MALKQSLLNAVVAVALLCVLPMVLPGSVLTRTELGTPRATLQPAATPRADDPQLTPQPFNGDVAGYNTADGVMNAAKRKARETVPRFVAMIGDRAEGTYSLKFPLTQNGKTEHIWLQVMGFKDGKFYGYLANTPVEGNAYKLGDVMTVKQADVEDWMVRSDTAIYGGYTTRVMLADFPGEEADALKKLFRD
jgi:uncharacterized protein YegJ (DUF2314 family)